MRQERWIFYVVTFVALVTLCVAWGWSARSQARLVSAQLVADASVATDLQALASETWSEFQVVFAARSDCFGPVNLHAARDLDSRAAYDPATATVTVRVPATAAMLREGLVHEWAHHVEFQCEAHLGLRPNFLVASALPPNTPWFDGETWAEIPSELYAEAVVELVLGRRQIPTNARIHPRAVGVVATWAAGD